MTCTTATGGPVQGDCRYCAEMVCISLQIPSALTVIAWNHLLSNRRHFLPQHAAHPRTSRPGQGPPCGSPQCMTLGAPVPSAAAPLLSLDQTAMEAFLAQGLNSMFTHPLSHMVHACAQQHARSKGQGEVQGGSTRHMGIQGQERAAPRHPLHRSPWWQLPPALHPRPAALAALRVLHAGSPRRLSGPARSSRQPGRSPGADPPPG